MTEEEGRLLRLKRAAQSSQAPDARVVGDDSRVVRKEVAGESLVSLSLPRREVRLLLAWDGDAVNLKSGTQEKSLFARGMRQREKSALADLPASLVVMSATGHATKGFLRTTTVIS